MTSMGRLAGSMIDIFFPQGCQLCDDELSAHADTYCNSCLQKLKKQISINSCPYCSGTAAPFEVSKGRCAKCRSSRLPTAQVVRLAEHADDFRQLVRLYKHHDLVHAGKVLSKWLATAVQGRLNVGDVEAVVAVPTHWRRRWTRPFHAADDLAQALARHLDRPCLRLLQRTRAGQHQIGLNFQERIRNVRGAFRISPRTSLTGAQLLLVDDVRTTGATMNECARVLRHAGASKVCAAVLATAPLDSPSPTTPIHI